MADVIAFPRAPGRVVVNPPCPISIPCDRELATERGRLNERLCRHEDGRVGWVSGVYREGLVVIAKLWRNGRFDPVRACRLTPTGGSAP